MRQPLTVEQNKGVPREEGLVRVGISLHWLYQYAAFDFPLLWLINYPGLCARAWRLIELGFMCGGLKILGGIPRQ